MKLNRNHFFVTLSLLFYSLIIFATGPSSIHSEIRPISINENGEILCRTKFTMNPMGAQKLMKIEYGFCILTKDTIIQYLTQEINPDGFPDLNILNKHINY